MISLDLTKRYAALFAGRTDAYGVDRGGVVKAPLMQRMYSDHLNGLATAAIGVFPLRDDGTVRFAAIDLDEPNFDLAEDLRQFIPGEAWIEKSRSGNAHIWCFFADDCPAWIARGQLRQALKAQGREDVEIFPKQAQLRDGMVGNYINLPYYGDERPVLHEPATEAGPIHLEAFIECAASARIDVEHWRNLCRIDGIEAPSLKVGSGDDGFGERKSLHVCATYMLQHKDDNPLAPGHRHVVIFNLAKMILNCQDYDTEDAIELVSVYNEAGEHPLSETEVRNTVLNAARGRFTSTGCDDPIMSPYVSPDCGIANG